MEDCFLVQLIILVSVRAGVWTEPAAPRRVPGGVRVLWLRVRGLGCSSQRRWGWGFAL